MTARDGAGSVQGEVCRITPLNEDGTIDIFTPILATEGWVSLTFSVTQEDGESITRKAANGKTCVQYEDDPTMSGISVNLSLCTPDVEQTALLAGGKILATNYGSGVEIEGYTSPPIGGKLGRPVCIEIWSKAIVNGKIAVVKPYWHWIFPYVKLRFDGDREFGNDALANDYSGNGLGNEALVSAGINPSNSGDDFVKYKASLANAFSYIRDRSLPPLGWTGTFDDTDEDVMIVVTAVLATGVTAGTPGTFTPSGAETPESIAHLNQLDIGSGAAWDTRAIGTLEEYVVLTNGEEAYWNGTLFIEADTRLDVSDLAPEAAALADLATLIADGTYGDGNFAGGTFATGQFITLADDSIASYDGINWSAGAAA